MKRLSLLLIPFIALGKSNIVFIFADDLGIKDLSIEGSTFYETPHIDALAKSGMRFTNGYSTCQVCSPSRASIMSGQYPARIGITDWIGAATGTKWKRNDRVLPPEYAHNLPAEATTMAEALKEGGYRTFFAGKWHLGGNTSKPEHHGFEINKGGHHRGSPPGGFFSPYENPELEDGPKGESLPIRRANETVKFIKKDDKKPFFAFLSLYSGHGPIQTTPDLWEKYRKKATTAGLKLRPENHIDGQSLVEALQGKQSERSLFWHYPHYGNQGGEPSSIIRKGNLKLIRYYEDGREELYNLKDDIGETKDLAQANPEVVTRLGAELSAHLIEVGAKIPLPDSRFDSAKKKVQLQRAATDSQARLEKQHANFLKPDYQPNKTWWGSLNPAD